MTLLLARLSAWASGMWIKVAVAGAFVGLLLLACLKLIGIGRKAERAETLERVHNQVKEARDVENRVDAAGADELERMRRKWERP